MRDTFSLCTLIINVSFSKLRVYFAHLKKKFNTYLNKYDRLEYVWNLVCLPHSLLFTFTIPVDQKYQTDLTLWVRGLRLRVCLRGPRRHGWEVCLSLKYYQWGTLVIRWQASFWLTASIYLSILVMARLCPWVWDPCCRESVSAGLEYTRAFVLSQSENQ